MLQELSEVRSIHIIEAIKNKYGTKTDRKVMYF